MKLSILFLAILGVTITTALSPEKVLSRSPRALKDDFYEFVQLLPLQKIGDIWVRYINEDYETQTLVWYLNSDTFEILLGELASIPEVRVLLDYLAEAGLDLNKVFKIIRSFVAQFELEEPSSSSGDFDDDKKSGGIVGLIAEIKAVLPREKIYNFYKEKLRTSEDFARLVKAFNNKKFEDIVAALVNNLQYKAIMEQITVGIESVVHLLSPFLSGGEPY